MDTAVLTKGRYRNKTYLWVAENHPDYCKDVLEADAKNGRIPVDPEFIIYLKSKSREPQSVVIQEQGSSHFVTALTPSMREELKGLLGDVSVQQRNVHPACQLENTNGFLGVFYRYFIKKCVFNLRDEDGYNSYIDNYATIFPFEVTIEKTNSFRIHHILTTLRSDNDFRASMEAFLYDHFDVNFELDEIMCLFLSNIDRFQCETNMDLRHLENVVKNESSRPIDGSGDRFGNFRRAKQNPYLETYPRLNEEGARRYLAMYNCYEQILNSEGHDFTRSATYKSSYFLKLPERNFYELLSLLDSNLFQNHFETYVKRFQKYLFFFIGALQCPSNPVFFIDDVLFDCLKSLQKFKKSRADPADLLTELKMMTLVHRRKQACDRGNSPSAYAIDHQHLKYVKEYIENFPKMKTARVEHDVPHDGLLECKALLCLDDAAIDVRFSKLRRGAITDFFESFLMAAICEDPIIEKLIIYNAYAGVEYSLRLSDSFDRAGIRTFVRKHNKWDFSITVPPEKGLTWGWEEFFVPGTIDWEEKRRNKPLKKLN